MFHKNKKKHVTSYVYKYIYKGIQLHLTRMACMHRSSLEMQSRLLLVTLINKIHVTRRSMARLTDLDLAAVDR